MDDLPRYDSFFYEFSDSEELFFVDNHKSASISWFNVKDVFVLMLFQPFIGVFFGVKGFNLEYHWNSQDG
jgi:hypothetical protein